MDQIIIKVLAEKIGELEKELRAVKETSMKEKERAADVLEDFTYLQEKHDQIVSILLKEMKQFNSIERKKFADQLLGILIEEYAECKQDYIDEE